MNTEGKSTVLLADDHPLFRAGVRQVIESSSTHELVAEVGDGEAAVEQILHLQPDFALLDLSMPFLNGFEVLQKFQGKQQNTRFLIISMYADHSYAERARDLGAVGYVAKEDAISEMVRALDASEEAFFMSQSVGARGIAQVVLVDADQDRIYTLSIAERRVLLEVSLGKTSKEIAKDLGVSPRTVDAHRRNCAEKLAISGRNKLLEFAIKNREKLG